MSSVDADADKRCAECTAVGQLSSCSLSGWERLLLRVEKDNQLMVSADEPVQDQAGRREVLLTATGMNCPECMMRAGAGAMSVKGVNEVEIKLAPGQIRVLLQPWSTAKAEEIATAIRAKGFGVRLREEDQ